MATTALVQAHIDEDLKVRAEKIFAEEGLTLADALRMLLVRAVHDQSAPLDLFLTNAGTAEAIAEADSGHLPSFTDLASLKAHLNADV